MAIPFIDLRSVNSLCYKQFKDKLDEALDKSDFILGSCTSRFENSFANYISSKYAVSCNSGTDALFLSLKALGIGSGDEVITTSFSFAATLEVIMQCGAKPRFVDIDEYYLIKVNELKDAITPKTKAILPVDLFGNPCDTKEIVDIARKNNLRVVEDAAQAHGSHIDGKKIGSFADLTCFSFYPTKILGAIGDGGLITTDDPKLFDILTKLRNHGGVKKYQHDFVGYCSRLDNIQGLFLDLKLQLLDSFIRKQKELANLYSDLLVDVEGITLPKFKGGSNYFIYAIKTDMASQLHDYLHKNGIGSYVYYPYLLPELFGNTYESSSIPNAFSCKGSVLALPLYPTLKEMQVEQVCRAVQSFFAIECAVKSGSPVKTMKSSPKRGR